MVNALATFSRLWIERSGLRPSSILTQFLPSSDPVQARREGGCDGCARTPPQTAEVHFFVKKINSKKK